MAQVRFLGILQGQGKEWKCEGWVTQEVLPDGEFAYTKYRITEPKSSCFAQGVYALLAHGEAIEVRPGRHGWVAASAL